MADLTLLSASDIEAHLAELADWTVQDNKLHKTFKFPDFVAAMGFMTQVAFEAERLCHHPNWSNVYNTVEVTLWTHDAGGLTKLDISLARAMDARAKGT